MRGAESGSPSTFTLDLFAGSNRVAYAVQNTENMYEVHRSDVY